MRRSGWPAPDAYEAELDAHAPHESILAVSPEHPMILMYTSGTTGEPKGALLPHRKTLFNSLNAELFFGIRREDRVLVTLPLFHSFGLAILSLPALYAGAAIFLEPRFDAALTWQRIASERITYLGAVPTQLAALLAELESHGPRRRRRACASCSARAPRFRSIRSRASRSAASC
jgi:acyl-CoA synthetase (AMP-forming)/AMP-acid ligase II